MRIISMVPSWTETIIAASSDSSCSVPEQNIEVVGRTRFCIHPASLAKKIPAVGGTKDIDWQKVDSLRPELIILDREENPQSMASEGKFPIFVSHVQSLRHWPVEMLKLGEALNSRKIKKWSLVAAELLAKPITPKLQKKALEQLIRGQVGSPSGEISQLKYIIWQEPWMSVSGDTFIGTWLQYLEFENFYQRSPTKYPVIESQDELFNGTNFFASEPFPFHRRQRQLEAAGLSGWLIDGELLSWFGIRSLRFLASIHGLSSSFLDE